MDTLIIGFLAVFYGTGALILFGIALSWRRHRRFLFISLALTFLLYYAGGLAVSLVPGSTQYQHLRLTWMLLGRPFLLSSPVFSFDSERAFNGDGYSIYRYSLPLAVAESLERPPETFFTGLPKKPSYRSEWKTKYWRRTPVAQDEQEFVQFASPRGYFDDASRSEAEFLQQLLREEDNYYAYFYFMAGPLNGITWPGNIDFFVLSPRRRVLYVINHNT